MYSPEDYDFELPDAQIAQKPMARRDASNLLLLHRGSGAVQHHQFHDVDRFLAPGDLLVINNTRVVPVRLFGKKATGGRVEVLILDYARSVAAAEGAGGVTCECLVKSARPCRPGTRVFFDEGLVGETGAVREGVFPVTFHYDGDLGALLDRIGNVPLPPYIQRSGVAGERSEDLGAYQTVYASRKGAAAAPTAGLHFTPELMRKLQEKGVGFAPVTLHVGYGTFRPVKVADIRAHEMHREDFSISRETADAINLALEEGRRVVAVGTTCVRTLEYAAENGRIRSGDGACDLFIYPGFRFQVVGGMITNFHLPKSTLMMLVSAFAGREKILGAYREAVARNYRFFSYGDAMMIV